MLQILKEYSIEEERVTGRQRILPQPGQGLCVGQGRFSGTNDQQSEFMQWSQDGWMCLLDWISQAGTDELFSQPWFWRRPHVIGEEPRGCGFFSETAGQLRIEHVLWCAKEASAPTQITVIAQSHDAKHHAHIPKMCSVFSSQWDDPVPGVAQVSPASGMPAAEDKWVLRFLLSSFLKTVLSEGKGVSSLLVELYLIG